MAKKLSTEEILAQARAQSAKASGGDAAESPAGDEPAAAAKPVAKSGGAPGSTADILAAARAQASGGSAEEAEKPAAAKPAAKKPAAAPGSTADILAAARAAAGGGSAEAAAPAEKKAAPKAAAKKPAGEAPSVEEMLKAVREGKKIEAVAAQEVVEKPKVAPIPKRPVIAKKPGAKSAPVPRREVLIGLIVSPFVIAWVFLGGATLAAVGAMARFFFPNVLVEPPTKFKIGPASDYPLGTVSTKWKATRGVWIVHTDQYDGRNLIYALSTVCTHLGCTPSWLEGEQKYKCPCHGSGFYVDGINFEGPAPRPLERMGIRVAEDGMLEVDKSVKFQQEMGQWDDGASYVEMA